MEKCDKCKGLVIAEDAPAEPNVFHYEVVGGKMTAVIDANYPEGFCSCAEDDEE